MENSYVKLLPKENGRFIILGASDGQEKGWLYFVSDTGELTFFINEQYRGDHLAANAVYLALPYLHRTYQIKRIFCRTKLSQSDAVHVLEHNGFERTNEKDGTVLFIHEEKKLSRDDDDCGEGEVLYFAGGCFWGMEKVFRVLDGVTQTRTGYANGTVPFPTYETVCRMNSGYRETVRVRFDPKIISPKTLLTAFFMCIDPEQEDGQGNDRGTQYLTGVYYKNKELKDCLEEFFSAERKKHSRFYTELKELDCFYEAEEYHQNYLEKHPYGYCHITAVDLKKVKKLNHCEKLAK